MATNSKETQRRADDKRKGTRGRTWAFLVYPESAPADWVDLLSSRHVRAAISPLHDRDVDPDGTPKKAHWHVLLDFDSLKTSDQVAAIAAGVGGTHPIKVDSMRGYARYLVHMDDPEKAQYSIGDVRCLAGFDIRDATAPTKADKYQYIKEMMEFVREQGIIEITDLMDYAAEYRFDDWFPLLCDNSTYVLDVYIRSMRHQCREHGQLVPCNTEQAGGAVVCDGDAEPTESEEREGGEQSASDAPSEDEAREYAEEIGMEDDDAYHWYNAHASCGWLDGNGKPIEDWRKALEGHVERLARLRKTGPTLDEVMRWAEEEYSGMCAPLGVDASEHAMFWYVDMRDLEGSIPDDWREQIGEMLRNIVNARRHRLL